MAKHRPSRIVNRRGAPASSFDMILNPLTAGTMNDESYSSYAADFIGSCDDKNFPSNFSKLYKKERFKGLFNASKINLEEFYSQGIFIRGMTFKRMLLLYSCIFAEYADKLNSFVAIRDKYEAEVLLGNYDSAQAILSSLATSHGESLWYIRNKITLLGMKGALQEMQEFAESCKQRSEDAFITFLINCFLMIASDPQLHLEKLIKVTIRELDEAGSRSTADLLSLLFVPRPLLGEIKPLACLKVLQSFSYIDHYSMLLKLLPEQLLNCADDQDEDYLDLCGFISDVQRCVKDHMLPKVRTNGSEFVDSELVTTLVKLYEEERNDELLARFGVSFESMHTPFTFVNLIAKALRGGDHGGVLPKQGPVCELINSLTQLYSLSAPPNNLEHSISKIIIQLQGFADCAQLQLCLYKSMPLRYEKEHWIQLANIARLTAVDFTPLSTLLTTRTDPVLTYKYLSSEDRLPSFRRIKAHLQKAAEIEDEDIISIMSFSTEPYRAKDIYETVSACYLRAEKTSELIELAGKVLSASPNAYIALPMTRLIEEIECGRIYSLDALIIIYYYVKKIDSSKEYLLNETYEEFIADNGVTRPSELLAPLGVDLMQKLVFFREISTLETMDFLGSFADSNDLRAERVRILDYLRDVDRIDPERYRTEVDEIVLQVIVDAGATEFNVAKIDVNDIAIRRGLADDFSSLFNLYKSVKQEKEQQIIRFDSDLLESSTALVAGDKNTTLLKMINLVEDAFMNDEKHGLDKNLSTEIRHGFFSNLMRSKLEEAHLLTEIDEYGEYETNVYWLSANSLVVPELLVKLDTELKWFSSNFNNLIAEAEEWMKVASDVENKLRVFNYRFFVEDLEELREMAEISTSSDNLLDFCISKLWDMTEVCMQEMREKLNVELKSKVDNLFDELIERINDVKSGVVLFELMRAIVQTKSDIREDITTASEWFKRSAEYAATARTINDLIDISVECFDRVKGIKLKVIKQVEGLPEFRLDGRNLKAFIIAVVNILENACRHSGFAHNTAIEFTMCAHDAGWQLSIANEVTPEIQGSLAGECIANICSKMKEPSSINMMKVEGGSGLSKAYNQLRSISTSFDVNVELINNLFVARISYVN